VNGTSVTRPDDWIAEGLFTAIDRRFADLIARLSRSENTELWLAAALASNAVQNGHVCLDIKSAGGKPLSRDEPPSADTPVCPPWESWRDVLRSAQAVGAPGDFKPLILDDAGRLYLYRYWRYEKVVAEFFQTRIEATADAVDLPLLRRGLDRLFPPNGGNSPDYQRIATLAAVCRTLAVITGGPGTGKTSTVVKVLALLLEQSQGTHFRIALAAPTGKAAARLSESVRKAKQQLDCAPETLSLIPEEASTLHRLLGAVPHSTHFRFDAKNPLPFDAVAVDEASMIDLPLMAKLVQALAPRCRLILLGDRDQLASVQPGAVFGDICGIGEPRAWSAEFCRLIEQGAGEPMASVPSPPASAGLQDSIVTLQKSYRFGTGSGIGTVSRLVRKGEGEDALEAAASGRYEDIAWKDLPPAGRLERALGEIILEGYGPYLKAATPEAAFEAFSRFRILCAVRQGPFGVAAVNAAAMNILDRAGLIHATERWFRGQPVLVTVNDYQIKLFNGDIGIVLPDPEDPAGGFPKRIFFPSEGGGFRKILPMRLPEHEAVYAMTVHKSQGSEFDRVLLILPHTQAAVLTRELIYTGITRAMHRVEIWGSRALFVEAVARHIERTSGLHDALWKPVPIS
jgi:exodeoxyribonuclease V alpha subunit